MFNVSESTDEREAPDPHVTAVQLADGRYGVGHWAACKHPERPPDDMAVFYVPCSKCQFMIHAALNVAPPEGSGIYPGWFDKRTQFLARLARPTITVIAHKPDAKWRNRHAARQ